MSLLECVIILFLIHIIHIIRFSTKNKACPIFLVEVLGPTSEYPFSWVIGCLKLFGEEGIIHVLGEIGHFLEFCVVEEVLGHSADVIEAWHQIAVGHRPAWSTEERSFTLLQEAINFLEFSCEICFGLCCRRFLGVFSPVAEDIEDISSNFLCLCISLWLQRRGGISGIQILHYLIRICNGTISKLKSWYTASRVNSKVPFGLVVKVDQDVCGEDLLHLECQVSTLGEWTVSKRFAIRRGLEITNKQNLVSILWCPL